MDATSHDTTPADGPGHFNERDAVDLALLRLYRTTRSPQRLERLLLRFDLLLSGVVSPWSPAQEPADELVPQLALLGFLRAIERYDQSCGVAFATFARAAVITEIDRRHAVAARTRPGTRPAAELVRLPIPPDAIAGGEVHDAFELLGDRDVETLPLAHIAAMLRTDLVQQTGTSMTQVSRVLNRALVRMQDDLRNSPDLAHADDPSHTTP